MSSFTLYSIIESSLHPNFSALYRRLGMQEIKLTSTRQAIGQLKKQAPDYAVAEFFYGFGNNYAGINVSNLDVFLRSLQKYAPQCRVVVIVDKSEFQYVEKLNAILPVHAVLQHPVSESQMEKILGA